MQSIVKLAILKDYLKSYQKMHLCGGRPQKIAAKAEQFVGVLAQGSFDRIDDFKTTNHGETRIKSCKKLDLGDGFRLITIQENGICTVCFIGSHADCDDWLDSNRGASLVYGKDTKSIELIRVSNSIEDEVQRITAEIEPSSQPVVERLPENWFDIFAANLKPSVLRKILSIGTLDDEDHVLSVSQEIEDSEHQIMVFDVLLLLRENSIEEAMRRIELFVGTQRMVDSIPSEEIVNMKDGETVKLVRIGSNEYLELMEHLRNSDKFEDWMLFMHPEQQRIVDADFGPVAKLAGVSGSGKTSIVVNRAVRLAKENSSTKVLILTLNRALSKLINELVDFASQNGDVRGRIFVASFFEVCQKLLKEFEPENIRLYDYLTSEAPHHRQEHIDEIWREYYRCLSNNSDAFVMNEIHRSLSSRGIDPELYLRQEFDWIRSAFPNDEREDYLGVDRIGRSVPFVKSWRVIVLKGLAGWERKMEDVGAIDHLGLVSILSKYRERIQPNYDFLLVDEMQDFGTTELEIAALLVRPGKNSLFLCGDVVQRVTVKQQSFIKARIQTQGSSALIIRKNYRNSREILVAADKLLRTAISDFALLRGELEVLDPELSSFSTWPPLVLRASCLKEEIASAIQFSNEDIGNGGLACIAIAGYTLREIQEYGKVINLPVLDGTRGLSQGRLFLSDLEQTKGYEFDTVCILNLNHGVIPGNGIPTEERYRDACQLYVAMTRTKRQLVMSYSDKLCEWIEKCGRFMNFGSWSDHIDSIEFNHFLIPTVLSELNGKENVLELNGRDFLYTSSARGLSTELQGKILELVNGESHWRHGKYRKWDSMKEAITAVSRDPISKQLFGLELHKELLEKFTAM